MVPGAQPLRASATIGVTPELADPPPMSPAPNSSARVPKFAVRNRTLSTSQSSDSQFQPTSLRHRQPTHQPRDRRPTDASARSASSSTPSETSHAQPQQPKKKKAGVFSFFTLKEPSTSAWDEYAATQRQTSASKPSARKTAVGMAGVSSQKLPTHVPKVNSKWDGLPDGARKKLEYEGLGSKRGSKRFSGQTWGTNRTNNLSSDGASSQDRGYGSLSGMSARSPGASQRPPTHAERPESAGRVLGDAWAGAGGVNPATRDATARAEAPTIERAETPTLGLPDVGEAGLDLPDLAGYEAAAYIATSDEASPLTPPAAPADRPAIPLAQTRSKLDIQDVLYDDTADYEPGTEEDAAWLAEHSVIRTYRTSLSAQSDGTSTSESDTQTWDQGNEQREEGEWPLRSPDPRPESQASVLTTITTTATVTDTNTDFTSTSSQGVRTSASYRTLDTEVTRALTAASSTTPTARDCPSTSFDRINDDDCDQELELGPQRSNSDTSVAPSVLSAQWAMSPKERLGLGGKVRRSRVLPWELDRSADAEVGDGKRVSVLTTGSGGGKKNRLSAILGRK